MKKIIEGRTKQNSLKIIKIVSTVPFKKNWYPDRYCFKDNKMQKKQIGKNEEILFSI